MDDIRKAYRTYAAKFHPDKHEGDPFFEERFKDVKEAYEILSDTEKRWKYDIKTFGKSKVILKPTFNDFDPPDNRETEPVKRRLTVDVRYIDIYVATFYCINLTAWVIIKKMNENATPGGYLWGLFLSGLSSLLLWLFTRGLIDRINRKDSGRRIYWVGYLLLALVLAYVISRTQWIPE